MPTISEPPRKWCSDLSGGGTILRSQVQSSLRPIFLGGYQLVCLRPHFTFFPWVSRFTMTHYNIELKSIDVNGEDIKLPTSILEFVKKQTVIVDSGTTLAYFPDEVYDKLMEKIMAAQPDKKPHVVEKMFKCYKYSGNIDDGFPVVNLHFANSLSMKVIPHQYFFQIEEDEWCIGFQNSNLKEKSGEELTLLGDLVLSDKLVTYDLENQVIGWTDYDCSSSIKVKDEESGNVYEVGAQDISSSHCTCNSRTVMWMLLFFAATCLINE